MSDTTSRVFRYLLKVALLMALTVWMLFKLAAAQAMNAQAARIKADAAKIENDAQPISPPPAVLRAGQSVPVSCLNGTLRIEVAAPKLIVATCGNAKTNPLEDLR